MIFALDVLQRRALADVTIDLRTAVERTLELWAAGAGLRDVRLGGDAGSAEPLLRRGWVLWLAWRLTLPAELRGPAHARVRENTGNETNEVMWGARGRCSPRADARVDREERWLDAWSRCRRRSREPGPDGLWTQLLSGRESRYLGPTHGAVGNVLALLDGSPDEDVSALKRTLERTAVVEDGLANWPSAEGVGLVPRDGVIRVQWCHGAPGIVTSAPYLDEELAPRRRRAHVARRPARRAEGPGICHGTAGNGYALLKTFERTGDEQWLDRARCFAVHALEQVEQQARPVLALHGRPRRCALRR